MKNWYSAVLAMVIIIIAVISLIEWMKPPFLRCHVWGRDWSVICIEDK